jgi:hypothetical protein
MIIVVIFLIPRLVLVHVIVRAYGTTIPAGDSVVFCSRH